LGLSIHTNPKYHVYLKGSWLHEITERAYTRDFLKIGKGVSFLMIMFSLWELWIGNAVSKHMLNWA
jgi:hypothetical protein